MPEFSMYEQYSRDFCSVGSLHSKDKLKVYLERYRIFCIMKSLINYKNKFLSNIHVFNAVF